MVPETEFGFCAGLQPATRRARRRALPGEMIFVLTPAQHTRLRSKHQSTSIIGRAHLETAPWVSGCLVRSSAFTRPPGVNARSRLKAELQNGGSVKMRPHWAEVKGRKGEMGMHCARQKLYPAPVLLFS